MRRPKTREIPVRGTNPVGRTRCTRAQPSRQRVTRKSAQRLTGISPATSFALPRAEVQPLRTFTELARSIFDAARDLLEDRPDLVET